MECLFPDAEIESLCQGKDTQDPDGVIPDNIKCCHIPMQGENM